MLEPIDQNRTDRSSDVAPPPPRHEASDTSSELTGGAREIKSVDELDAEQIKLRLSEVEAEVSRLRKELAPLTQQPYADMFDRGDFTTTDDAPPIDNERLMAVRTSRDGRYHTVYLPREGFEYEYSLFDEIVRLGSERSTLEAERSRLRR